MATNLREDPRSIPALFREVVRDAYDLVRQEIALAKAEAAEKVSAVENGIAALAIGGAVAFAGLLVLLDAAVFALGNALGATLGGNRRSRRRPGRRIRFRPPRGGWLDRPAGHRERPFGRFGGGRRRRRAGIDGRPDAASDLRSRPGRRRPPRVDRPRPGPARAIRLPPAAR
jgi:hypothetical protein